LATRIASAPTGVHYRGVGDVLNGFVRAAGGAIATFEAPGEGAGANEGTSARRMNTAGGEWVSLVWWRG
jgi:hypothetical protein